MKKEKFVLENATMLSMFDECHQKMLNTLQENTSASFMNLLMKILMRHKCVPKDSPDLTDEDIQLLTHADRTILLLCLNLHYLSRFDSKIESVFKKKLEEFKDGAAGEQVGSLLLVLCYLLDLEIDDDCHDWPEFMVSNSKMCN